MVLWQKGRRCSLVISNGSLSLYLLTFNPRNWEIYGIYSYGRALDNTSDGEFEGWLNS